MAARLVFHNVSLDPNPGIGILFVRVISKVSTAAGSAVGGVYTAQPIVFNPIRDLGTLRNASRFFSGAVAGHLGRDPESTAPITYQIAMNAFRVFMSQGRTRGVRIHAEFEVVLEPDGFFDGGVLVLDALPYPENLDYVERHPNFVGSNRGIPAGGFMDGGALVLDSLPPYEEEVYDSVDGIIPNFVRSNRGIPAGGFMDGGALVLDSLPPYEEEVYDSVDGIIPNFVRSNRGMTAAEISRLEKVTQIGGEGGTCSVCLDDFSAGDLITPLTPCSHSFHAGCIEIWLRKSRSCPVCRTICTTL
ncbi:unnamed protein product [Cuscuta campestris]|uniref:RING-type domain-containing protein n=1 Tax=Cuscuta campestris TaxID=132261 RepID=A0A484MAN9_9ASTE|nr:unnamed protein product [Cuscuta campestris]